MSENLLQLAVFLKLIWVAGFAFLYASGGISGKWKRRYIGPAMLTAGIGGFGYWLHNVFNPWLLLYIPLLSLSLSIGYGATITGDKIWKRVRAGLAYGVAATPVAYVTGQWLMLALHTFLCVLISVFWGVLNPVDARHEESTIGFMIGLTPILM